ncbi:hypothetical protein LSH36_317g00006 [Paralvinella palmiformis]|uniref:TGF-beta family profile domain-containing protein n=1 Tax=Paralvinella palmiformis TaxID=53620 RepID=A0AAD9N3E0_9ANNE|nr:hypothetical protein LSH36_317g00006 [Paralvinella palmiformis]
MLKWMLTLLAVLCCCSEARKTRHRQPDFIIRDFLAEQNARNIKDEPGEKDFYPLDSPVQSEKDPERDRNDDTKQTVDIMQALKDFGLENVSEDNPAVAYMLEVYRSLESGASIPKAVGHKRIDVAVLRADTIRGLPAKKSIKEDGSIFLTFNLSNIARQEVTKKAELRLRVVSSHTRNQKYRTKVRIFRNGTKIAELKYTVKSQREASTGTDVVDLTPVLQTVIDGGYGRTIIEVKLRRKASHETKQQRRQRRFTAASNNDVDGIRDAILVLFTRDRQFFKKIRDNRLASGLTDASSLRLDSAGGARQKRANQRRERLGARKLCQRYNFTIDFAEIGWDKWIIYPKKYNAFYCMGRCPTPVEKSYEPTNHAILQGLLRMADKTIPRPCCIPTKLRPLSMLYYEYNEIIVRQHKNMIANNCGCR